MRCYLVLTMSDDPPLEDDPLSTASRKPDPHSRARLERIAAVCEAQGIDDTWAVGATIRPPELPASVPAEPQTVRTSAPSLVGRGAHESLRIGALPEFRTASASEVKQLKEMTPADLILIKKLGEGGMGFIQLAEQTALDREVAIKRIRPDRKTRDTTEALLDEARLTGGLEHPNIIPVHTLGRTAENEPLMVMKRVEGVSWQDLLIDPDHPSWWFHEGDPLLRHLEILTKVMNAIEFAHARGVLHLDIKPENVMLGEYGEVYLMDWGVAQKLEHVERLPADQIVGTPSYMAPEMVRGCINVTPRSDVFLLGATLHEILTGQARHQGDTALSVMYNAMEVEPFDYPESVPAELARLCNKACALEPGKRFSSVTEMRRSITKYLEHRGSIQLAEASIDRLTELRQLLADPEQVDADRELRRRVQELFNESRFGLAQALRDWPHNERAEEALQDVLELWIDYELRQENAGAVEALIAALPEKRPELSKQLTQLRERLALQGQARLRLEELEREMAFRGENWKYSVGFVLNGIVWSVGLAIAGFIWDSGVTLSALESLIGSFIIFFGHGALIFILRDLFLSNRIRRRFTLAVFVYLAAFILNRAAAGLMNDSMADILVADFTSLAVFLGVAAALVHSAAWWACGMTVATLLAAAAWPEVGWYIASLNAMGINLVFASIFRPEAPSTS